MGKHRWTIIRDSREKPGHGYDFGPSAWCGGTVVGKLDAGDYAVSGLENRLIIERKESVSEIAGNLTDPRFPRELERLRSCDYPLILCHFGQADIERYPEGSSIPAARRRFVKVKGPFLLRLLTEVMVAHPWCHWLFFEDPVRAKEFARTLLKRTAEAAEAEGLEPPAGEGG